MSNYFTYDGIRIKNKLEMLDNGKVITTNKGDLIGDNGEKSTRLEVGNNGQVLYADTESDLGFKWSTLVATDISDFDVKVGNNTAVVANTNHSGLKSNPHEVNKEQVGLGNVENLKVNLVSQIFPAETDDINNGYSVGSRWINTETNQEYVCVDASAGTAVWTKTTEKSIASNVGNSGVGIFKVLNGYEIQLKNINAGSDKVYITDDTNNDVVDIDILEENILIGNLSGAPTGPVVGTTDSQVLTSKTINAELNIIRNIGNDEIKISASIDATKIAGGDVNNENFNYLKALGSAAVGINDGQNLSNKTLIVNSTTFSEIDNETVARNLQFNFSKDGDSATYDGQTINISVPDGTSYQLVGDDLTQTLSNKTLVDPIILDNTNNAQITFDITNSCSLTVPNPTTVSEMTLVGTDLVQTLKNKTMGTDLDMGSYRITNVDAPLANTDAANKQYVDGVASGLDVKESVLAASTMNLASDPGTNLTNVDFANDTFSLTIDSNNQFMIDGVNCSTTGTRILLKNQDNGLNDANNIKNQNGIWIVTIENSNNIILNRANDFTDTNVTSGAFTFVEKGETNADSGWVLTTDNPIVIGTSDLEFSQFSGAGQISAGYGLTKDGNELNVVGSTTILANANSLEVKSSSQASQILLSTGNVHEAAAYGPLPLANNNAVSGVLPIAHGGTGTGVSAITADRVIAINENGEQFVSASFAPSEVVLLAETQTLINKKLITDNVSFSTQNLDKHLFFDLSDAVENESSYLKVPSMSLNNNKYITTLVGTDVDQILSNKKLNSTNVMFNGPNSDEYGSLYTVNFNLSNVLDNITLTVPNASMTLVGKDHQQTLTKKDLFSNNVKFIGSNDTISVKFNLDNITDGKVLIVPDPTKDQVSVQSMTLVGTDLDQTLINKKLNYNNVQFIDSSDTKSILFDLPVLTNGVTSCTVNVPNVGQLGPTVDGVSATSMTLVGTDLTQDLTNKTLITPTINNPSINNINDSYGNELIKFTANEYAVNELTIENAVTGFNGTFTGPTLSASGVDDDINLYINPKGTGNLILDGLKWPTKTSTQSSSKNQVLVRGDNDNLVYANAPLLTIGQLQTTTGGTHEIASKTTFNGVVYLIDATIVARRVDGTLGAGFILRGMFRNNNGLVKIGEDKVLAVDVSNDWDVDVECKIDSSNLNRIVINVIISNGNENNNTNHYVNWKCSYKCTEVA